MTDQQPRQYVVLVVDDEPVLRMVASQPFEDAGCTTYEAGRADEASTCLKTIPTSPYYSPTSTCLAPRMASPWLALFKKDVPDIRLILTSGRVQPAPADIPNNGQFIAKPYGLDVVTALVTAIPLKR